MANEFFGWLWITCGMVSGALIGLHFHKPDWLGGYGSLARRMVRLGHIAFFGLGLLNLLYAWSTPHFVLSPWRLKLGGAGMIVGGVTMPLCCFLTAWKPQFRHLFPVPVTCLLIGGVTATLGLWP